MSRYSINELEALVQEGKLKKKEIKSTYTSEFLISLRKGLKGAGMIGLICGVPAGLLGLVIPEIPNYEMATNLFLASGLGFGLGFGALGIACSNFDWKEKVKRYVKAGGKIIYKEKGLKWKKKRFVLPSNYNINDPDKKISFGDYNISPGMLLNTFY